MAEMLDLEYEDRQRLKFFTIGAVDMTKRQRANARKQRKREQDRDKKRQKRGSVSREQYLAEARSSARPWEALGMTRSKYYRLRRETRLSSPHTSMPSDNPVSPGLGAAESGRANTVPEVR
jgi:hypothetical protein